MRSTRKAQKEKPRLAVAANFNAALTRLDDAEQRVLRRKEPSTIDECARVLAAKGPFDILGVSRDANDADVRARRNELAQVLHPDKVGKEGNEAMKRVNDARDVLMDPNKRAAYAQEYPLGGFTTKLHCDLSNALDALETARRERLSYALQTRVDLDYFIPPKGAETTCKPTVSQRLLKSPQVQLLRKLKGGLEVMDMRTAFKVAVDDKETRIAVLECLVHGTLKVELPFEVVTLTDGRGLVFPDLASVVHNRFEVVLTPLVTKMRDDVLDRAIHGATTTPRLCRLNEDLAKEWDVGTDQAKRDLLADAIEEEQKKVKIPPGIQKLIDGSADDEKIKDAWRKQLKPKITELTPEFARTFNTWVEAASQDGRFVNNVEARSRKRPRERAPEAADTPMLLT